MQSLARAAQWDAAGNHSEAINELARGARDRDVHCTRLLGLRLLIGDRAPLMPDAGLRLLGEACDAGLGEAAARAAGILALGLRDRAAWPQALIWLARSAAAGWQSARDQLLALCDDRELAARVAAAPGSADWRVVAAAVRVEDWRQPPSAQVLHDTPRIALFPQFLRSEVCACLVGLAKDRLGPARVYDVAAQAEVVNAHRTNTIATFHVDSIEVVHVLLQERMAAACGMGGPFMEPPSVLHYSPGEQIRDHYDFVDPKATPDYDGEIARHGQRVITFLAYLNDDYDGGETDFPRLQVHHKGQRGEGLYFVNAQADLSPELRMLHAGRPTTRGEKWIVSQFVRSKPMR